MPTTLAVPRDTGGKVIEIPEAYALARQAESLLSGKTIRSVVAGASPHKWAWFHGDATTYDDMARGRTFDGARNVGGFVEFFAGDRSFAFGEGIKLRFYEADEKLPAKHQLLVSMEDGSSLVASVQMYGWIALYEKGTNDNSFFTRSLDLPSPLSDAFDRSYFDSLLDGDKAGKLSAKALLATEQRIPGFGNGVLQDVLFDAQIHPKRKLESLDPDEIDALFQSVRTMLGKMADQGGRDTELDLKGLPGGYKTVMSRNNQGKPCPVCGEPIVKAAYLGGSVYFCPGCQLI